MQIRKFVGIALVSIGTTFLSGCGGGDTERTSVSKPLARSQIGQVTAQESINRTVSDLKAAGVQPGTPQCALRSSRQPAETFYVVVDIPAGEVPAAKGLGFQTVAEVTGTDTTLIPLDCATL